MTQRRKQIEKLVEDFHTIKRKMSIGVASHCLKGTHITASQWLVLQHLRKNEKVTIKELAKALSITSSATTQLVESLVQKKYVIKKTSSDDKRALSLSLSEKSKKRMEALRNKRIQYMEHIFDVLTDDEFESYCYLLNKIIENTIVVEK